MFFVLFLKYYVSHNSQKFYLFSECNDYLLSTLSWNIQLNQIEILPQIFKLFLIKAEINFFKIFSKILEQIFQN